MLTRLRNVSPRVTVVNILPHVGNRPDYAKWIVANGAKTSCDDTSFDVVFCNSVIEHVGGVEEQMKLGTEIRRLEPFYFVQTLTKYFPIEPHMIAPHIHWTPKGFQRRLFQYFALKGLLSDMKEEENKRIVGRIYLLGSRRMQTLFPDAELIKERFLGLTKSIISIRRP